MEIEKKDFVFGITLVAVLFTLIGALIGLNIGREQTRKRMINNFELIRVEGEIYRLNKTASFEEGCYVMPKYHKAKGSLAYIGKLCISMISSDKEKKYTVANNSDQYGATTFISNESFRSHRPRLCEYKYKVPIDELKNSSLFSARRINPRYPCEDWNESHRNYIEELYKQAKAGGPYFGEEEELIE